MGKVAGLLRWPTSPPTVGCTDRRQSRATVCRAGRKPGEAAPSGSAGVLQATCHQTREHGAAGLEPKAMDGVSGDRDVREVDCVKAQGQVEGGTLQRNGLRPWWLWATDPEGENFFLRGPGAALRTGKQVVIFTKGRSTNNNWLD